MTSWRLVPSDRDWNIAPTPGMSPIEMKFLAAGICVFLIFALYRRIGSIARIMAWLWGTMLLDKAMEAGDADADKVRVEAVPVCRPAEPGPRLAVPSVQNQTRHSWLF